MAKRGETTKALKEEIKALRQKVKDLERLQGELLKADQNERENHRALCQLGERLKHVLLVESPERMLYVGPSYETVVGRPAEELYDDANAFALHIHPEDRERIMRVRNESLFQEGKALDERYRFVLPDGAVRWMWLRSFPIKNVEGKVDRQVGLAEDITDRKQVDDELRRQLSLMESLLEAIPAPVYFKNTENVYFSCNEAFAKFVGRPKEKILGKSVFDLAHEKFAKHAHAQDLQLLKKPGRQVYETPIVNKNGQEREVVFHKATISDPSGAILGLVGVILDIKDLKDAEREQMKLRNSLFQAQKMEAMGTLTGGLAHDFNNLFTVINGYTELLLLQFDEDDPNHADLKKVLETGLRGADLVKRLMTFGKKTELSLAPLDLNKVVLETANLMQRTFPMVEVETSLAEDLPPVNADAVHIEQVIMNLGFNAREAMPEGGKILIESRKVEIDEAYCKKHIGAKPGPAVVIVVSDTGKGISSEDLDKIFDPFFTTKGWDFRKGTGLGLSVVKSIVEQHDGWVSCKSDEGKGASFGLYFPTVAAEPAETRRSQDLKSLGETILLVDDEEWVRDLGARVLKDAGYRVILAENGRDAVQTYQQKHNSIDLILLDLIMPGMGGEECLRKLLEIDPEASVIIASGFTSEGETKRFLDAHARALIGKPYRISEMLETIRNVLNN